MQPPTLMVQLFDSQTIGPQDAEVIGVSTHAPHDEVPASPCSHALHVVCVADAPRQAATNDEMSSDEHAFVASFGGLCGVTENPLVSHSSHATVHWFGGGVGLHGPLCAMGFGAPCPHAMTDVPSHAHDGSPLHAICCMQIGFALQPSLIGYWHV